MRTVLTLAAAAVVNLAVLAALEWNVTQAQLAPPGEVTITQVEEPAPVAPLAQVQVGARVDALVDGQVARTASSSL